MQATPTRFRINADVDFRLDAGNHISKYQLHYPVRTDVGEACMPKRILGLKNILRNMLRVRNSIQMVKLIFHGC